MLRVSNGVRVDEFMSNLKGTVSFWLKYKGYCHSTKPRWRFVQLTEKYNMLIYNNLNFLSANNSLKPHPLVKVSDLS